jgi:hypothetical protein
MFFGKWKAFVAAVMVLGCVSFGWSTDRIVWFGHSGTNIYYTIHLAVNAAVTGDRVLIHGGTYNYTTGVTMTNKNNISLLPFGDGAVSVTTVSGHVFILTNTTNCSFQSLTINPLVPNTCGILLSGTSNGNTINNCFIIGNYNPASGDTSSAIRVISKVDGLSIYSSTLDGCNYGLWGFDLGGLSMNGCNVYGYVNAVCGNTRTAHSGNANYYFNNNKFYGGFNAAALKFNISKNSGWINTIAGNLLQGTSSNYGAYLISTTAASKTTNRIDYNNFVTCGTLAWNSGANISNVDGGHNTFSQCTKGKVP